MPAIRQTILDILARARHPRDVRIVIGDSPNPSSPTAKVAQTLSLLFSWSICPDGSMGESTHDQNHRLVDLEPGDTGLKNCELPLGARCLNT